MKFNLKKLNELLVAYNMGEPCYSTILNIKAFCDGFEAELRERLVNHDCDEKICLFSKIIKEILGE